ncbi:M10 family metallopeptidase C-terminal domain-containing protein [Desulfobacter curvatus]|uniref:M10 family metallopeptidase C-terminal domain-containing protein n=1 Tax=Desulfobacter curvatus TaxID=2290 RepID=UPI0003818EBC|nr:M10 family metallopeptidase C-terminal domain-containing protein [Desulfobacter curvatus]
MDTTRTPVSNITAIDALITGQQWGNNQGTGISITYSIPNISAYWVEDYGSGEPDSWTGLDNNQADYFRMALAAWAEVADITFVEIEDNITYGEIRVAFSQAVTDASDVSGWAYVPGSQPEAGDIWLDSTQNETFAPGTFGYSTLLHEIGHSLGLSHPFEANTTNGAILNGEEDSTQYSVMSYTDYDGVGSTFTETSPGHYSYIDVQPTTPMLYDILAIQYLYGPNLNTRTGDDIYTFSNSQAVFEAIWDAGGIDTFDLSNQSLAVTVNLTAGTFSSIGIKEVWDNGIVVESATDNIAIAYDVTIENVIGGSGDDQLIGNAADNQFTGGPGNDIIIGDDGVDTAIYNSAMDDYTLETLVSGDIIITATTTAEGIDTLTGIEWLQFEDKTISTGIATPVPTTPDEVAIRFDEGSSNQINYFLLSISTPMSMDASVSYKTVDGTAVAGQDYIFTSGIATIAAGETSTAIPVEILGDTIIENDETFFLEASDPEGGVFPVGVQTLSAMHTIINDDFTV